MTVEIRQSATPEETERIASALAMRVAPGTVITLEGDLGAGKTCFVRGLARGLGADPAAVSSPTFVIEHRHACDAGTLVHIDAYRIRSAEDLASIGWHELLADGEAVVIAAGDAFEVLGRTPLGGECRATPAVAGGRMVFRTVDRLLALDAVP